MPHLRLRPVAGALALALAATGIAVALPLLPASATRVDATCANTADDAKTMQAAIDSSKDGDEVVFKGPCLINATITLLDRRTYRGDAKAGTVIKQADGANLPAMLASESWVTDAEYSSDTVRIERLTLDGNRDNNTGTVGLMLRSWNARVYDVDIYGAPSDGIRISNPSKNGTLLRNTMVNSVISDVDIEGAGGSGLKVVDPGNSVTDWTFQRSWIGFSGASAIESDNAAGWTFSDLHLYGTPKHAIDAHRCFGTSIQNNYIEDFGGEGAANQTYYGVRCDLQGEANTTISNNRIHRFLPPPDVLAGYGKARKLGMAPPVRARTLTGALPPHTDFVYLALDEVNYGTGHASVTGNTILGQGTRRETGMLFEKGQGDGMSIASTGNLVDNVGNPRVTGSGVRLTRGY
ncbi:right-handed parallel beta-helix repeat-containing protein [Sphaerisporangium perillae]|uniref:right-handed parallel beta-helix repeat-containing protein n=1 Tax=Sphaerisporangium perillae TaxID=2935860 RepID=UPI00200F463C|nr:right-handed parallel beta-helix repeat-containing protein [Sphaerisporangium perillae]